MTKTTVKHNHKICIQHALQEAESVCKDARLTPLRKRVLELVWQSHRPVKAYDLLEQMGASSQPPTVYRALDFLIEHGLVHRIHSLNAFTGCAHPKLRHSGYFFHCTSCREVKELEPQGIESAIAQAAKEERLKVAQATLEIQGTCAKCQSR